MRMTGSHITDAEGGIGRAETVAFDDLSADYDASFSSTHLGSLLRHAVASETRHIFRPGLRALDLGCGTGEDALRLARRGLDVHGIDASAAMIARARSKAALAGVDGGNAATFEVVDLNTDPLPPGPFDAALSNFGVLNCLRDRRAFAGRLAQVLKPGARTAFVIMGRWCAWEWLWYLGRARPGTAFRRIPGKASFRGMDVFYPMPRRLEKEFRPHFRCVRLTGIGLLLPPTFAAAVAERHTMARWMAAAERRIRQARAAAYLSDHFLIEFERV